MPPRPKLYDYAYDGKFHIEAVFSIYQRIRTAVLPPESSITSVEEFTMLFPELDRESEFFVEKLFTDLCKQATPPGFANMPIYVDLMQYCKLIDAEVLHLMYVANLFRLIRNLEPRESRKLVYLGVLANALQKNISTGSGSTCMEQRYVFIKERTVEEKSSALQDPSQYEATEALLYRDFYSVAMEVSSELRTVLPEDQVVILDGITGADDKPHSVSRRLYQRLKRKVAKMCDGKPNYRQKLYKAIRKFLVKIVRNIYKLQKQIHNTPRLIQRTLSNVLADVKRLSSGDKKKRKGKGKKHIDAALMEPVPLMVPVMATDMTDGDSAVSLKQAAIAASVSPVATSSHTASGSPRSRSSTAASSTLAGGRECVAPVMDSIHYDHSQEESGDSDGDDSSDSDSDEEDKHGSDQEEEGEYVLVAPHEQQQLLAVPVTSSQDPIAEHVEISMAGGELLSMPPNFDYHANGYGDDDGDDESDDADCLSLCAESVNSPSTVGGSVADAASKKSPRRPSLKQQLNKSLKVMKKNGNRTVNMVKKELNKLKL